MNGMIGLSGTTRRAVLARDRGAVGRRLRGVVKFGIGI